MNPRDTLKDWWQSQLAIGIVGLIASLIERQWTLAGIAGFIGFYALLVIRIKSRRARGRKWT